MRIIIIIPPRVHGQWVVREEKHVAQGNKEIIPRTASLLTALLQRELGPHLELSLIEAQRDHLNKEEVLAGLDALSPHLVICYLSCFHIPWDRACAETGFPTIAVILQQNIDHREALELYGLQCAYVCKHEIEYPVVEAVKEFMQTGRIQHTKGFLINTGDGVLDTGDAQAADLDSFPIPYHTLFDIEKYFRLREQNPLISDPRSFNLNTMKGCLFQCAYCGQARQGNRPVRTQSARTVLRDLRFFYDHFGIRHFAFADNEFAVDMNRAKSICQAILESGIKIHFVINNRVELFDEELIRLLREAGCVNIRLGIETCDPDLQRYINKRIDLNRAKRLIQRLNGAGFQVHLYMTPGIPGEKRSSLDMAARFIAEANPFSFSTGPLFLMPNSPLYRRLSKEGKILEREWSAYRALQKLCYVNESYKDIREVRRAEQYLVRKASLRLFVKRIRHGSIDLSLLARILLNTQAGAVCIPLVLRLLRFYRKIRIHRGPAARSA